MQRFGISTLLLASSLLAASAAAQGSTKAIAPRPGAVFTMSNDPAGNSVIVLARSPDGLLSPLREVATGGKGVGMGLGNQSAVALSRDHRLLAIVNPGSDDVSLFSVREDASLDLLDTIGTGGVMPVSVALHRDRMYVLDAGGSVGAADDVVAFDIGPQGRLRRLRGSAQLLSQVSTGPAQVGVSPDGRFLVVTEKMTNAIDVFVLGEDGRPAAQRVFPSTGMTPFGFAFRRGQLFVSDASGGMPDQGALSSYRLTPLGGLVPIDSLGTTETAACWVALSRDGRFAYTTNTGSASVTGYAVDPKGGLTLLDPDGVSGTTGAKPIDLAFSEDGRFLYTLDSGAGTISAFRQNDDGSLVALPGYDVGLGTNGLAAR